MAPRGLATVIGRGEFDVVCRFDYADTHDWSAYLQDAMDWSV